MTDVTINGLSYLYGGTITADNLGSTSGGALGAVNAVDVYGATPDWCLEIGLIGASHLNLHGPMQFVSSVAMAGIGAEINVAGIQNEFAGVSYNMKNHMMDFVSKSDQILASMPVYNIVPNTTWAASAYGDIVHGGVTLSLVKT